MTDVLIIGGGPGGYTAALEAAKNGLSVILFEKDRVGGTCLNRGCIPTKALIRSAEVYGLIKEADLYGVHAEGTVDFPAVARRRDDVVDSLRTGVEKGLKAGKVETVYGVAKILAPGKVLCDDTVYEGKHIIIASGSRVSVPPIEGREYTITSDEMLTEKEKFPSSLTIIGGGVIGVEIGCAYASLGCKVTILEMADHILPNMEREIAQRLGVSLKKKGIDVFAKASVKKISPEDGRKTVTYVDAKGVEKTVSSEEVLLSTGRRANLEGLFDEELGLSVGRGVSADEDGRTNVEGIYVIGDAKEGSVQLAHAAEAEAVNVIDTILGKEKSADTTVIPSCIYTDPEIASVGLTEEEAKNRGLDVKTKKALTGSNGKCLIENSASGYVKIVTLDDVIIGAVIIAPHATELIGEFVIAVERKMTVKEFYCVVHPHPTVSELLREAAKD
ncbi:MAG: dihydrolipoyl dehydrogenase [Erysipelotrichaceae bacterium]|nr:dihydrolipoyl dehydrogenase [Erysipelotrichaceae bacterium]